MKWTIIERQGRETIVKCKCGTVKKVMSRDLRLEKTTQCSKCAGREDPNVKKYRRTKVYNVWVGMKTRCFNKNSWPYKWYGARGITVCDRWLGVGGFSNFLEDVGLPPSPQHSLDRINNDGNYEPGNVRWATLKEQANNRRPRNTVIVDKRHKVLEPHD